MTTIRGALRYVVYYRVDEGRCFWFVPEILGEGKGFLSPHRMGSPTYQEIGIIFARR